MNNRIFLWTTRRVLSNAFSKAIYQLQDDQVHLQQMIQPFRLNYYFGKECRSEQMTPHEKREFAGHLKHIPTIDEINESFEFDSSVNNYNSKGRQCKFIKEHAFMVWPNIVPDSVLVESKNTFLIRNPEKAIKSLWRQILTPKASQVSRLVKNEVGFKELYLMHSYINDNLKQNTIIIDADDLLKDAQYVLKQYCNFVDLKYSDNMINWHKFDINGNGTNDSDNPWDVLPASWVADANQTNGFRQYNYEKNSGYDKIEYPKVVFEAIQESLPYYEKLYQKRLKL